jgi:hypothetical protein
VNRDLVDLISGALLALVGLIFLVPAFGYGIGSLTAMGAGFLPMAVSAITIGLGLAILVQGLRGRLAEVPEIAWRPLVAVAAGMAAFALLVERLGMVPAIIAAVFLAALGDRESRPLGTIVLAVFLCIGVWLVFAVGLGLPIRAFRGWR